MGVEALATELGLPEALWLLNPQVEGFGVPSTYFGAYGNLGWRGGTIQKEVGHVGRVGWSGRVTLIRITCLACRVISCPFPHLPRSVELRLNWI